MGNQLGEALKALGLTGKKVEQTTKNIDKSPGQKVNSTQVNRDSPPQPSKKFTPTLSRSKGMTSQENIKIQKKQSVPWDELVFYGKISTAEISKKYIPRENIAAPPIKTLNIPDFEFQKLGEFHPHPLFTLQEKDNITSTADTLLGIKRQLSNSPEDETDLIIGLDFGTSATKMVIRDAFTGNVFPVKVNKSVFGLEQFLQASCVFLNEGIFEISGKGERLDDLKLSLLACKAPYPVTEFNYCCAYLALMIRSARGWFLAEHESAYRHHKINWHVNIGIATRSYEDRGKVQLFRRLAWAAANLAADANYTQIKIDSLDKYRKLSRNAFESEAQEEISGMEFNSNNIGVIPEIAAQIQGFMASARWSWTARPIMMLVDVGAGTVDTALFHVNPSDSKLTFYSSRVEPNGAMNLHRERVTWLMKGIPEKSDFAPVHDYLKSIEQSTGRLLPIPSSVIDYLPGYSISKVNRDIDEIFRLEKYRTQVAGSINEAKLKKGIGAKGSQQLVNVPLLLCGGGSRLPIYLTIADEINKTPGWSVSVEKMLMPVPPELREIGWHSEEFDRISVAYGLSLQRGLEKIVSAVEIPDITRYVPSEKLDNFVSKDQC
jgi:hypothetical protein